MILFDASFAQLFRAVDRVRVQLESANSELKPYLAQELTCLSQLAEQVIDRWMALDEQIQELMDTFNLYELSVQPKVQTTSTVEQASSRTGIAPAHAGELKSLSQNANEAGHIHYEPSNAGTSSTELNLAQAVFSWSDEAVTEFRRGLAFYDLLMWDQALSALMEALAATDSPVVRLYVAAALAAQERGSEARVHIRHVLNTTSDKSMTAAALEIDAQIWLAEGRIDRAAECFQAVVQLMPASMDGWFNLALSQFKLGHLEVAEEALRNVLAADSRDVEARELLVSTSRTLRGPQAALRECLFGLNHSPSHKGLQLWKSKLLYDIGEISASDKIAGSLAAVFPDDAAVVAWSCWISLSQGRSDEAVGRLKRRLSLSRNDGLALLQLGITYLMTNHAEEAEPVLWAALPGSQDTSLIWLGLAAASSARLDFRTAQKRSIRAIHDKRVSVRRLALYQYGKALQGEGRHEEAETYLRAAHLLGTPNAAILSALAETAEVLGRPVEAKRRREQAESLVADGR